MSSLHSSTLDTATSPDEAIDRPHGPLRRRVSSAEERSARPGERPSAIVELAVVAAALIAYMAMRIVVEGSEAEADANTRRLLALEGRLGIDIERGVQQLVVGSDFWVGLWNGVYQWLYWPSVGLALVVLWFTSRARYLLLRNSLIVAAAIGLVIFFVFPVAPPRFTPGYVDTMADQRSVVGNGRWVNVYAAMPSFHVGWPALAAAVVSPVTDVRFLKALIWAPAALIAVAVIATGNHFVLDVVGGLLVVSVAHCIASAATTNEL